MADHCRQVRETDSTKEERQEQAAMRIEGGPGE
jgi:hypothetical protein